MAAEFERPVLLFSGGKDSIVMLHLAVKAFTPARVPFPVMHVDTGHNFAEVLAFRDAMVEQVGARLIVASVQDDIDAGTLVEDTGPRASRNRLQTTTLLRAIEEGEHDAVFGGARRDEEKARAKERVFSFRDDFGQWDPKNQRPELWNLYNGRHRKGEHIRVFPLSNWTELDIWQYIADEGIDLPSIYYAHPRRVFQRDGMWMDDSPLIPRLDGEQVEERMVRFRTVGDITCTGAVDSAAATLEQVIAEVAATRLTERGATRADDRISEAGMEDRKKRGLLLMEMLRLATAGSVDDGKSTLIGRLLYDSKAIFEDQLEAVERTSRERGDEYTNLALLTDGLRAEREQGITIDVAYRYFATPKRKFIIADTPGHIQYTRNMVTGASTADLALILIDARKGVLEQSRRHAFLASLLGIPHLVLCVNKMDLVDWSEERFEEIKAEFRAFAMKLDVHDLTFIPVSALHGDNIVDRSANMPWYEGSALLHHLEEVHIASDRNLIDARFPVQYVIRPQNQTDHATHDYRGYAGQVAGGVLKQGDEVVVLPSGFTTTIASIDTADGTGGGGVLADVGHPAARRRDRREPRRHDRPAPQPAPRRSGHRGDGVLDVREHLAAHRRQARDQAHHPVGPCPGEGPAVPARREHAAPLRGRRGPVAQRDRPRDAPHHAAAVLRRVPAQPLHRQLHPRRRGHPHHGGRRHDPRPAVGE